MITFWVAPRWDADWFIECRRAVRRQFPGTIPGQDDFELGVMATKALLSAFKTALQSQLEALGIDVSLDTVPATASAYPFVAAITLNAEEATLFKMFHDHDYRMELIDQPGQ